jgi:radical SAM superfamily enzyme YgiQ (UPF0313 family)
LLTREQGTITKDWGGRLPVAIVYPSSYYIGMSNLGIQAIYRLFNGYPDIVAERFFWDGAGLPLRSLESRRPLADFALVTISVPFELDFFHIPKLLRASGIPLYAAERDSSHPVIIAGGATITANPMPLAHFFDGLCVGEAESILPAVLSLVRQAEYSKRDELLAALARLPGVYAPLYHGGEPVIRQWTANLDDFPVFATVLTRDTELGDLYLIEAERGCTNNCRFCLVSTVFCPARYRSLDSLLAQAQTGLKYRRRLGLVGPDVSSHPQLEELLTRLRQMGAGLSISSLRVKPLSGPVLEKLAEGGVKTIALAPEAGSPRLRRLIGKRLTEDDILRAVEKVAEKSIRQLKLYFMVGLPTETDEDMDAIIRLAIKCKGVLDRWRGGTRLSLNIAPFVPKAGTPFQWLPMAYTNVLKERISRLSKALLPKGIKVKSESPAWSEVQGVLARGDSTLASVLNDTEELSLSSWRRAVARANLEMDFIHRRWPSQQRLPWSLVDLDLKKDRLETEMTQALGE